MSLSGDLPFGKSEILPDGLICRRTGGRSDGANHKTRGAGERSLWCANRIWVGQCDGAPPYSITSFARPSNECGTAMPSDLADLTLMTSSNFVGV